MVRPSLARLNQHEPGWPLVWGPIYFMAGLPLRA
jgi:hypothetical protein